MVNTIQAFQAISSLAHNIPNMADTYNDNAAKFQVRITQGEMHAIIPKTGAEKCVQSSQKLVQTIRN